MHKQISDIPLMEVISSADFSTFVSQLRFSIVHHGYVRLNERWAGHNIHTNANILFLVKKGAGVYIVDGKKTDLLPNKAYLFPRGSIVSFSCPHYLEKFFIHFRLEAGSIIDLFDIVKPRTNTITIDGSIFSKVAKFNENDARSNFAVMTCLYDIISLFTATSPAPDAAKIAIVGKYAPLTGHLEAHLGIDVSIASLAKVMGVTGQTLSRQFKNDTGTNLKRFIIRKVLEKAEGELIGSEKKIREIATGLHFHDQLYFSKFFKKHTGLSPVDYRAKGGGYFH